MVVECISNGKLSPTPNPQLLREEQRECVGNNQYFRNKLVEMENLLVEFVGNNQHFGNQLVEMEKKMEQRMAKRIDERQSAIEERQSAIEEQRIESEKQLREEIATIWTGMYLFIFLFFMITFYDGIFFLVTTFSFNFKLVVFVVVPEVVGLLIKGHPVFEVVDLLIKGHAIYLSLVRLVRVIRAYQE